MAMPAPPSWSTHDRCPHYDASQIEFWPTRVHISPTWRPRPPTLTPWHAARTRSTSGSKRHGKRRCAFSSGRRRGFGCPNKLREYAAPCSRSRPLLTPFARRRLIAPSATRSQFRLPACVCWGGTKRPNAQSTRPLPSRRCLYQLHLPPLSLLLLRLRLNQPPLRHPALLPPPMLPPPSLPPPAPPFLTRQLLLSPPPLPPNHL